MSDSEFRFALVGAGCIGQIRAKALANMRGCRLTAVADKCKDRTRAVASSRNIRVFDDYRPMLSCDDIDAIVVSTPPQSHEEIAIAALEAGKHVLCEKPLANTVDASRRMLEASRRTGRTLATGFNHRYFPAVQYLKKMLDSGAIGELDHVRAFAGHTGLSEFREPWMYEKKALGGGALMDVGIHLIDLTRYILNEIDEVFGVATSNIWKLDRSEDNGIALMRGTHGKNAVLHATWTEWKGYRFHIDAYGERGMLRAYYAPMMSMGIFMDKPGGKRRRCYNFYPKLIFQEKLWGWQSTARQALEKELADFVELTRGKNGTIADGFAGFRAVEIADAIYRSAAERRPVRLSNPV